jgi:hypothetical protein
MSTRLEDAIVFHQATGRRKISQFLKGIPKFEYVGDMQLKKAEPILTLPSVFNLSLY